DPLARLAPRVAPVSYDHRRHVELLGDDPQVGAQREPDLLRRRQPLGDRVERTVEGRGAVPHGLVEEVLLRVDVRVERALLDAHRPREVADRGAVVALLGEEPGGLAREFGAAAGHARFSTLTIVR